MFAYVYPEVWGSYQTLPSTSKPIAEWQQLPHPRLYLAPSDGLQLPLPRCLARAS
jgi:hypothetical protein